MPILHNAQKALRVSKRKALVNQPIRSRMRTMIDKAVKSTTPEILSQAFSAVDKAVKRHLIHRNKAARIKSRLAKRAVSGSAAPAGKSAPASKSAPAGKSVSAGKPASATSKSASSVAKKSGAKKK